MRRSRDWERQIAEPVVVDISVATALVQAPEPQRPASPLPSQPPSAPRASVYPNQPPIVYPTLPAPNYPSTSSRLDNERYRRPSPPRQQSPPRRNDAPRRPSPPSYSRARVPSPQPSSTAPLNDVLPADLLNTFTIFFLSSLPLSVTSRSHIANVHPQSLAPDCTILYKPSSSSGARSANVAYRSRRAAAEARRELEQRWRIFTEDRAVGEVKLEWGDVRSELRERMWIDWNEERREASARENRASEAERRDDGDRRSSELAMESQRVAVIASMREPGSPREQGNFGPVAERRSFDPVEQRRSFEPVAQRRPNEPPHVPVERGRKPRVEWGAFEGPSSSADWESSELKRSRVDVASADFARLSAATASLHEGRHSHPNAASNVRLIGQTPSNGGRSAQASRPAQASFPWVPSPAAANDVRSSSSRLRTTSTGDVEGSEPVKRARTTSETANARTGLALHQPAPCRLSSNLLVSRLSRRLTRGSLHRGTGPIDPVPPRARSLRPPRLSPSRTDSDRSRDVPELHRQRLPPSERPLNPRVPADLGTTKQAPGRRSSPRTAHSRRARRTVELSCRTPVGRTRASKRGLVVESL